MINCLLFAGPPGPSWQIYFRLQKKYQINLVSLINDDAKIKLPCFSEFKVEFSHSIDGWGLFTWGPKNLNLYTPLARAGASLFIAFSSTQQAAHCILMHFLLYSWQAQLRLWRGFMTFMWHYESPKPAASSWRCTQMFVEPPAWLLAPPWPGSYSNYLSISSQNVFHCIISYSAWICDLQLGMCWELQFSLIHQSCLIYLLERAYLETSIQCIDGMATEEDIVKSGGFWLKA